MDTEHSAITEPVRRIEVFTGTGRRRAWSFEDKARIVAESVTSGESVCAVARRHGLSPQQLFGWRRQIRQPATASTETAAALFVPAVVEAPLPEHVVRRRGRNRPRQGDRSSGIIEVEIDGVTVRVGRGAEAKTVAAVLRALKAGA
jgi:transposase